MANNKPANEVATTTPNQVEPPVENPIIKLGDSSFGKIVTDNAGRSLYTFAGDTKDKSNCTSTCLEQWPPLTVSDTSQIKAERYMGTVMAFAREDGAFQISLDGRPLYYYKEDTNPGDIKGEGLGKKWSLARTQMTQVLPAEPAKVSTTTVSGISLEEVAKHNTVKDCYMAIGGKVYDLSGYASQHPAGENTITDYCGKEASEAFATKGGKGGGHSSKAANELTKYYKGELAK